MNARSLRLVSLLAVCGFILGERAAAQTAPPQDSRFSPQLFHPALGPDEFLTVEPARPLAHLNFSLGAWLNYTHGEFTLSNVDANNMITGTRAQVIGNALGLDLGFAIGLFDRLQVGLLLPATLFQGGDSNTMLDYNGVPFTLKVPTAFALGDPMLDVKARLYGHDRGVNLSVAGFITAPLSRVTSKNNVDSSGNFGGDYGVTGGGKLLAGWESDRWRAGLSVGFLGRQTDSTYFKSTVGQAIVYGGAFAYDVVADRKVSLVGELFGHVDLSNRSPFGENGCNNVSGCLTFDTLNGNPLELDVAGKVRLARSLFGTIGLGTGLVKGLGEPQIRVLAGITWAPDRRDRDKDGVPDIDDKCPDVPEDHDGFQDDDGCPESDNDGDGIPDERDRCPNEAEDFDGFQDDDGCPDPDNDGDGIPDIKDACPMDKEDKKPPKPNDGCPLDKTDSDEDGVPDNKDKCPLDPEDKDGFQDDDGCPDVDNDEDGIPDQFDKCPNEAEDKDGFQDDDGCPDPDNDNDGIPDKQDKCPNQPETLNGFQDEDGCPDKGPPLKVQIVGDEIVILEKVFFKTGKAAIEPRSFNLLDQVASVLKLHPEIKKIEVQGHTDAKGSRAKNMKLSQDRANSVRNYVVAKGVTAERLIAKGYGPDMPVADNRTERGREANRRVQFKILESEKKLEAPRPPAAEKPEGEKPAGEKPEGQPAPAAEKPGAAEPAPSAPTMIFEMPADHAGKKGKHGGRHHRR